MSVTRRMADHRAKPWWSEVARAEFEHYASQTEARSAERAAIAIERPRYNIVS